MTPEEKREKRNAYLRNRYAQKRDELLIKQREYVKLNKEKIADYKKNYATKNKKEIAEYKANYAKLNKEKISQYMINYAVANKEKLRNYYFQRRALLDSQLKEKRKNYYAKNKVAMLEKQKAYYVKNKSEISKRTSNYYARNRIRIIEKTKEWGGTQKGKAVKIATNSKRRAIKKLAKVIDEQKIKDWIKQWKSLIIVNCHWCKNQFAPSKCHADHVMPLSKGGDHSMENLVIACASCNHRKNAKTPDDWIKEISKEPFAIRY